MRTLNTSQCEVRYNTLRGFYYKLQSTPAFGQAFADDGPGLTRAVDSSSARTNAFSATAKLFRVTSALAP